MAVWQLLAAAALAGPPAGPANPALIRTVSTGGAFVLEKVLLPERPNIVVFYRDDSEPDRAVVANLEERTKRSGRVGLRLVRLRDLEGPAAQTYGITRTPTLMVLDRFGNLLKRTTEIAEIDEPVRKAMQMARIKWVNETDPEAATAYRMVGGGRRPVAGILKTMSLRPELLEGINRVAGMAHFTDGALPRRTKEMIATYVSAINHCKF